LRAACFRRPLSGPGPVAGGAPAPDL